jgi:hypothetical protein
LRPSTAPDHTVDMGWGWVKSLLVAIEVISPSSIRSDRIAKRDYYLSAGVPFVLNLPEFFGQVWAD